MVNLIEMDKLTTEMNRSKIETNKSTTQKIELSSKPIENFRNESKRNDESIVNVSIDFLHFYNFFNEEKVV